MGRGRFSRLISDLLHLIFPQTCAVCHCALVEGEQLMCITCRSRLPITDYHLSPYANPLLTRLVDTTAPIEKAASMFYYHKEAPYSLMIQDAKYNNQPQIDRILASDYAEELQSNGFFNDINVIIPVPIHWSKMLKRGYNQSDYIALGLSDITSLPVAYNLKAIRRHATQTKKTAAQRRKNLENIFDIENAEELNNQHILLVDDVITTGSTILACAAAIHRKVPSARISVLSLTTTVKL